MTTIYVDFDNTIVESNQRIIELLKKNGITDIGVTLQFLPEKIEDMFGDGSEMGVNIKYFIEDSPLGTAGSVKNAEEFLDDTFVVISGDAEFVLDGRREPVSSGSIVRVSPSVSRAIENKGNELLVYVCIQAKEGSLDQYTMTDGVVE